MDIFFEIHENLLRQGPGDDISTLKAFSMLTNIPSNPLLLDIGCGSGMQTLNIVSQSNARVVALDNYLPFLSRLSLGSKENGFTNRVMLTNGSMFDLPFRHQSFDIIWSEGAIYIAGFENGLRNWKKILKTGGYLAVTEISWIKANPPAEILSYWKSEYPGISSVSENLRITEVAGYDEIGHFTLPTSSWWDNYYTPIVNRLPALQDKYTNDPVAIKYIQATSQEVEMYEKYSEWYGYVFYVLKST